MAFVVLYDACVLYPAPLRDLLIRIANTGIVRARWSDAILDECFGNILEQRPDLKPEALGRTRDFPDDKLAPHKVEAKHPDDFVLETADLAPGIVAKVLSEQAAALKNPPRTVGELLDTLRAQGLVRSVAKLRELFGAGDPIS